MVRRLTPAWMFTGCRGRAGVPSVGFRAICSCWVVGAFDLAIAVLWESEELKRLESGLRSRLHLDHSHTAGRQETS